MKKAPTLQNTNSQYSYGLMKISCLLMVEVIVPNKINYFKYLW